MMRPLIRFATLAVLLFAASPAVRASETNARLTEHEAYVLLDHLLVLSEKNDRATQLHRYKQWAGLHAELMKTDQLTKEQMKVYLFMVFIAEEKTKVDSLEEMAKEIVSKFSRQPTMMLEMLKENPFLLPAVCGRINEHFELFSTAQVKQKFMVNYKQKITDALGNARAPACLDKLQN